MTQRVVVAAALCLAGTYALGWVLIGDLSEVPPSADPDYMIRAPTWSLAEPLLALAGVCLWAVLIWRHLWPGAPAMLSRRRALLPVVLLGAYLAFLGRAVTAGVIGANIGGGMLLFFVTPWLVPVLVLVTARLAGVDSGSR